MQHIPLIHQACRLSTGLCSMQHTTHGCERSPAVAICTSCFMLGVCRCPLQHGITCAKSGRRLSSMRWPLPCTQRVARYVCWCAVPNHVPTPAQTGASGVAPAFLKHVLRTGWSLGSVGTTLCCSPQKPSHATNPAASFLDPEQDMAAPPALQGHTMTPACRTGKLLAPCHLPSTPLCPLRPQASGLLKHATRMGIENLC